MTTSVKVTAHCSDKLEVHIRTDEGDKTFIQALQNGESAEVYVYDRKSITVYECNKPINLEEQQS